MRYFAGLDVGLEETAICIIDSNERIVRELRTCSEPEALVRALRALPLRSDAIMWRQRPTTDGSMKPAGSLNEELDTPTPITEAAC